jgi:ribosomal protein L44E
MLIGRTVTFCTEIKETPGRAAEFLHTRYRVKRRVASTATAPPPITYQAQGRTSRAYRLVLLCHKCGIMISSQFLERGNGGKQTV